MDGLKKCEANLVLYLHPSKAKCVTDAINGELSSMLFTYNETLEGVVLAFSPIESSNLAKILPGVEPYFSVRLKAKFLLFNPMPDTVLEGKVVKITRSTICAEILGFAWASILDKEIREDFKHKTVKSQGEEVKSKHIFVSQTYKKHKIELGTIIRFVVKSFDGEMLHITGSMVTNNTGSSEWLDRNLDEWSQADRASDKRTREDAEDDTSQMMEKTSLETSEQVKRPSKRKKSTAEAILYKSEKS